MKKQKFITIKDRLKTTPAAAASLGILGLGLSTAFSPAVLGVAAGLAALRTAAAAPAVARWQINSAVKSGRWKSVPEGFPAARMAAEISEEMGRPQAPNMYIIDEKTITKSALPFGLRWLMKIPQVRDPALKGLFAAIPGTNTIIATTESLNNGLTNDQMRFIVAHEMSHLQAKDNRSPSILARSFIKKATRPLFWVGLAGLALSVASLSIPFVAIGGGVIHGLATMGILAGTYAASSAVNNIGARAVERRADRNALTLTQDLPSGIAALKHVDPTASKKVSLLTEALLDHSSFSRRIKAMTKDFEKVSKRAAEEAEKAAKKAAPASKPTAPKLG